MRHQPPPPYKVEGRLRALRAGGQHRGGLDGVSAVDVDLATGEVAVTSESPLDEAQVPGRRRQRRATSWSRDVPAKLSAAAVLVVVFVAARPLGAATRARRVPARRGTPTTGWTWTTAGSTGRERVSHVPEAPGATPSTLAIPGHDPGLLRPASRAAEQARTA